MKREMVQVVMVLALGGVLAVVLMRGGRKGNQALPRAAEPPSVAADKEPAHGRSAPGSASPLGSSSDPSHYTAGVLRDPLKSLLPQAAPPPSQPTPVFSEGGENPKIPRAPSNPPALPATQLPPMRIQGLIWGGLHPQAIVNNTIYRVGDSIGQAKIISISRRGLTVDLQGKSVVVGTQASVGAQKPRSSMPNAMKPQAGSLLSRGGADVSR